MPPLPAKKYRVLIVDDSAFMRKVLETIIKSDESLEVVGTAKDGREAVTLAESLKPLGFEAVDFRQACCAMQGAGAPFEARITG